MAQGANQISTTPPLPGGTLVNSANTALAALLTSYSGASAPSSPTTQQPWIDTSGSPIWVLKFWDGTNWIVEGVYDSTAHQFYGPVGGGITTVASSGTVDLGASNQSQVSITGTTSITSFGATALAGLIKFVTFTGSLTLTYNGTSLILPTKQNIQTQAGDTLVAIAQGSGNWIVWQYQRASGIILPTATSPLTLANGLNSNIALPANPRCRVTGPSGAFSIGGFTGGFDGAKLNVYSSVSQTLTVVNQDASSTAANRIITCSGGNIVLGTTLPASVTLTYDGTDQRWIVDTAN